MNEAFVHRGHGPEVVELLVPVPPGTVIDPRPAPVGMPGSCWTPVRTSGSRYRLIRRRWRQPGGTGPLRRAGRVVRRIRGPGEIGSRVGTIVDAVRPGSEQPAARPGGAWLLLLVRRPLDMRMDLPSPHRRRRRERPTTELVRVIRTTGRAARAASREIADVARSPDGELVDAIKAVIRAACRTGGHLGGAPSGGPHGGHRELPNGRRARRLGAFLSWGRTLCSVPLARGPHGEATVRKWSGTGPSSGHVPSGLPEPPRRVAPPVRLITRKPLRRVTSRSGQPRRARTRGQRLAPDGCNGAASLLPQRPLSTHHRGRRSRPARASRFYRVRPAVAGVMRLSSSSSGSEC